MTNNKRKILFFLPSSSGGAERMTLTIAKMLPKDSFECKIIIIDKTKGTISQFIPNDISWSYYHVANVWDFLTLRIYKILKKEKPYAVFCSLMYLSARVIMASKFAGGIRIIIRNNNYWSILRKDQFLLCKHTFKFADVIIAQQDEMRSEIIEAVQCAPCKVITLHNPLDISSITAKIDVPSPYPLDQDTIKYVWTARFNKNKGQDVLAKAFVRVAKEMPNAHLYYVGDYSRNKVFFEEVRNILFEGGCLERTHFVGFDNNPYKWMKFADCFVLPSRIEGLPNALIEAQYLGCPSVATLCIPMINRIITNGENGYVVPSEDANSMALAMLEAVKLGKIQMTYKPSSANDYLKLFNNDIQ